MYAFSFIYNTATGIYNTASIGGLNFSCLFERAEIQIPVNKCECLQRLNVSPGNLFWGSFTSHNTGNYFRQGINVTTNERLSPTFRGNGNTITVGDSQTSPLPIFPEGEGTSVHRLPKGGFVTYRDSFSYISLLLGRGVVRAHFGQSNFVFFQQKRKKEILLIVIIVTYLKVQKKKRKKENGQENWSFFHFPNFEVRFKNSKNTVKG